MKRLAFSRRGGVGGHRPAALHHVVARITPLGAHRAHPAHQIIAPIGRIVFIMRTGEPLDSRPAVAESCSGCPVATAPSRGIIPDWRTPDALANRSPPGD